MASTTTSATSTTSAAAQNGPVPTSRRVLVLNHDDRIDSRGVLGYVKRSCYEKMFESVCDDTLVERNWREDYDGEIPPENTAVKRMVHRYVNKIMAVLSVTMESLPGEVLPQDRIGYLDHVFETVQALHMPDLYIPLFGQKSHHLPVSLLTALRSYYFLPQVQEPKAEKKITSPRLTLRGLATCIMSMFRWRQSGGNDRSDDRSNDGDSCSGSDDGNAAQQEQSSTTPVAATVATTATATVATAAAATTTAAATTATVASAPIPTIRNRINEAQSIFDLAQLLAKHVASQHGLCQANIHAWTFRQAVVDNTQVLCDALAINYFGPDVPAQLHNLPMDIMKIRGIVLHDTLLAISAMACAWVEMPEGRFEYWDGE